MERTRKQEQAIVTHLFIFLLLSLVLVYLFIFYLLPKIKEIEVLKSETFARFEDTERVEKK
ncbi:MAG: hypothetical protein LBQ24_07170 [Candidatus Peribacteria bacterium]|jgi:cell division septal protein FtsQ|nr:hypothetical protein [Candidatus Peribacteria bacterium]